LQQVFAQKQARCFLQGKKPCLIHAPPAFQAFASRAKALNRPAVPVLVLPTQEIPLRLAALFVSALTRLERERTVKMCEPGNKRKGKMRAFEKRVF
jgi:hypothetical protein